MVGLDRRFPLPLDLRHGAVDMSHGSGGRASCEQRATIATAKGGAALER